LKNIKLFLYYLIASKLPDYAFPGGRFYNKIRISLLRSAVSIGEKCRIQKNIYVGDGNNVSIGNYCRINDDVKLDNVKIGNYVLIARRTQILGKTHQFTDTNVPMVLQKGDTLGQSIIEDDVWIGLNVIIMPNITIKKGCIIAAGAVLTKNTEEYGIYGGVPAKLIRKRK
jgi:acetyltransferase-like isoleucine patch superfamily enzyme